MAVTVDVNRVHRLLETFSAIGATPRGGVNRLAATEEDAEARRLLRQWGEALGLMHRVDAVGNQFLRWDPQQTGGPAVLFGSHLDSQPTGGRFDGTLGVVVAMVVIEALIQSGHMLRHPVELVNWTNEEGARFAPAMLGSGVYAGIFDALSARQIEDDRGISLGAALDATGWTGTDEVRPSDHLAYLELHIEQGPVLEHAGLTVGNVVGVQGIRWYDAVFEGEETHAGPMPMAQRQDPIRDFLRTIHPFYERVSEDERARLTIGTLDCPSTSRNTVPGRLTVSLDLRHPDAHHLDSLERALKQQVALCENATLNAVWSAAPVHFDERPHTAIHRAAQRLDLPIMDLVSGAGHDAVHVSRVVSTGMVFVRCRDGLSHHPEEYVDDEAIGDGARLFLETVIQLDPLL